MLVVCEINFAAMRINFIKAVISFLVNISLQDLLILFQKHTKSTKFSKNTKKLQLTWPLIAYSN